MTSQPSAKTARASASGMLRSKFSMQATVTDYFFPITTAVPYAKISCI